MQPLSPVLVRKVLEGWGERGRQWLDELPGHLETITAEWGLTVVETYPMTFHWVAAVTRADGSPAVLKLGVPADHLLVQAEALRIFNGDGSVRLLAADLERGALLLEKADPGIPVRTLVPRDDEAATAILIEVGRRLHRVPPEGCTLPHLRSEGDDFQAHLRRFSGDDPMPRRLVEKAAGLFDELGDSAPAERVLHADLHHDNVLQTRDGWTSIDPHGRFGDPGFEVGALLYNPDPDDRDPALLRLVPARIEQLADGYGMPVDRVRAWGFVMGVLSTVWDAESGEKVGSRALDVALLLD